ncbi:MAG TPA: phosphoglucosamine mutase [Burkholderiales bacterium]|nr:phosphoglucosamine mutase [Burkholderiales bacterium]
MRRKYFGTDGVRGKVGASPITPDLIMRLGYSAGVVLTRHNTHLHPGDHPSVIIGKDTRISGYMLESALQAGLSAAGVDVLLLGPAPTPAVAYLTRALRAQAGIVISASHNPFDDNGIKFFSHLGSKLPDEVEQEIEAMMDLPMQTQTSHQLGRARRINDADGRYIEFCKSTFPNELDLRGLKIVVDCAHGATYHIAPHVFHELGAEITAIGVSPDGFNINAGYGSTHPKNLQDAVTQQGADLGFSFDGDGDRLCMVDHEGRIFDGDRLLYILAKDRLQQGLLQGGIAGTLMTNLGFEHALKRLGIPFDRAQVGDRYVIELLKQNNWLLGGETSGHIICLDKHTTGDGIIAALQVLSALIRHDKPGSLFTEELELYPQTLINITLNHNKDLTRHPLVMEALDSATTLLNGAGRILLRRSGTEPLIRVMVEGENEPLIHRCAELVAKAVKEAMTALV